MARTVKLESFFQDSGENNSDGARKMKSEFRQKRI